MSMPSETLFAKNCTLAMVAPLALAVAVAVMLPEELTARLVGAETATVGAAPTVTLTALDVAVLPRELVTTAVSETAPALVGVHERLNGAVVAVPMATALARYCTLVTVPTGVEVEAVSVVAALMPSVAPAEGDVIETDGVVAAALTVTLAAVLVA